METMGERLKRLRVARGYTQPEFARLVGVTKSAVSQWEDDSTKNLKLTTLARVLDVLGTDLQYLVWGENRAPASTPPGAKPFRRRHSSEI
jgi:transcriptional regulator with XRE-family HTH domain